MNIEIKITAESVEEARAAFVQLAGERPATHITVLPSDPRYKGSELTIPAGTDLTIAGATRDGVTLTSDLTQEPMQMPEPEPEKPKRARKTTKSAAKAAETPQEPPVEPEAPQAEQVTAAPEKPAEEPVEAAAATQAAAPTKEQIATAGARLLDANPNAMQPLLDLLREYDVQAITYLKDDQLAGFAEKLRALGAEV